MLKSELETFPSIFIHSDRGTCPPDVNGVQQTSLRCPAKLQWELHYKKQALTVLYEQCAVVEVHYLAVEFLIALRRGQNTNTVLFE